MKTFYCQTDEASKTTFIYVDEQYEELMIRILNQHGIWGGKPFAVKVVDTGEVFMVWQITQQSSQEVEATLKSMDFVMSGKIPVYDYEQRVFD